MEVRSSASNSSIFPENFVTQATDFRSKTTYRRPVSGTLRQDYRKTSHQRPLLGVFAPKRRIIIRCRFLPRGNGSTSRELDFTSRRPQSPFRSLRPQWLQILFARQRIVFRPRLTLEYCPETTYELPASGAVCLRNFRKSGYGMLS